MPVQERHTPNMRYTGDRSRGRRVGSLWYSAAGEEGDVTFAPSFYELDPLLQADIVSDMIAMLMDYYDDLRGDVPHAAQLILGLPHWELVEDPIARAEAIRRHQQRIERLRKEHAEKTAALN